MVNHFIAYQGASYIRGFTVYALKFIWRHRIQVDTGTSSNL